jgi:tetratricopeptide (TPR) repeat protein
MFRVLPSSLLFALCLADFGATQSTDSKSPATPPVSAPSQAAPAASATVSPGGAAAAPSPLADALALYRKGNFTAALDKYQQLLQEVPKSPDAYAGFTRVYLKQGNVNLASVTATKGLELADSPRLHVALGEVYFRQGKIVEAEREWLNVINSGRLEARAFLGLARVRDALSMYKQGKLMIDKAHEIDPSDPDIENYWIETLTLSQRIHHLERYLDAADNGVQDRADTQRYLDSLKARAREPRKSCRLVSNVTSTETYLERLLMDPTHLRGYGLAVNVNGRKTKLMLDTGATGILIDRGIAEKAGITRLQETRIGGIGDKGDKSGYVGLANSIKIGELEFQDCEVSVLEKRSVAGEEGLIGADVFESFLVNIDFPKEKLRLSELPKRPDDEAGPAAPVSLRSEDSGRSADDDDSTTVSGAAKETASAISRFHDLYIAPDMKSYTRVYRFGHDLLVPTKVGNAPIKLFLIDTGSLENNITPAAAHEVTKVHGDSDTIVTGISGSVKKVYSADKAILQFGHLRQENQDLTAFDLTSISENAGTEISGILGFTTLHMLDLKIDYRDGLVDFNYKPQP